LERSESGVGNFGKVGVGHFTPDSATLDLTEVNDRSLVIKQKIGCASI